MKRRLLVEADGGSRGNPGVAGYGAVVRDAATGEVLAEVSEPIGRATNNVAEYSGLLAGLRAAGRLAPGAEAEVRMDSKLVVEQMSGRWQIKHPDLRKLAAEARQAARALGPAPPAGCPPPGARGTKPPPPTASPTRPWTRPPRAAGRPTAASRGSAPARPACGDVPVVIPSRTTAGFLGRERLSLG